MRQLSFWDLLILGGVAYAAYKTGQNSEKNKQVYAKELLEEEPTKFNDDADEEIYVAQILNELRNKPNKTQKDKYNIGLLEVKLQQLRKEK
jgi:hypothetical protein